MISEIYYEKVWKAYIDGEEAPYVRAEDVLRAMVLPTGTHTVEFIFRATVFKAASTVTLICSIIILAGFIASATYVYAQRRTCIEKQPETKN